MKEGACTLNIGFCYIWNGTLPSAANANAVMLYYILKDIWYVFCMQSDSCQPDNRAGINPSDHCPNLTASMRHSFGSRISLGKYAINCSNNLVRAWKTLPARGIMSASALLSCINPDCIETFTSTNCQIRIFHACRLKRTMVV